MSKKDYLFCILVGSLYQYSILRIVITSTAINLTNFELIFFSAGSIIFFLVAMYNIYTRVIVFGILLIVVLSLFLFQETFYYQVQHIRDIYYMFNGQISYREEFGRTIVFIISFLLGFSIAIFMYYTFNFIVLAAGGITAFIIIWSAGFSRDETAFIVFLISFMLILLRRTNRNMVFVAAPICVLLVLVVNWQMPEYSDLYVRRNLRDSASGRVSAISDFFYELLNPTYFSFAQTGFSGGGGILGGPVVPNNRSVMTVQAPGRTYLAGATSNYFSGDRWISTLTHESLNTHGLPPSRFEMLETSAALLRYATVAGTHTASITIPSLGLNPADNRFLAARDFSTLGVASQESSGIFYMQTYLPLEIMTVSIGENRTGSVFTPPLMTILWFYAGSNNYAPYLSVSPTGDVRAPGFMSRGTTYHMQFLNVDTNLSFIQNALEFSFEGVHLSRADEALRQPIMAGYSFLTQEPFIARNNVDVTTILPENFGVAEMIQLLEMMTPTTEAATTNLSYIPDEFLLIEWLDNFSVNVLAPYAAEVRENFLQVPEITPQRVHDLTQSIIEGLETDFDRVFAIRDFLLQFPYTLNPQPVPRGVCFVDHFLFEGQEGYCTYFASSMALMGRIAGIPTRYVEGFVLPPAAGNQSMTVRNSMAHAWVEVYFEGFGWVIVEATPTYAFLMNPEIEIPQSGGFTEYDDMARMRELMDAWEQEMMSDFWDSFAGGPPSDSSGGAGTTSPGGSETTRNIITSQNLSMILIGIVLFLLAAIFIFIETRRLQFRLKLNKIKTLSNNEQTQIYFKGLLDIIMYYTIPMVSGETIHGYGEHKGKRFAYRSDSIFFRDLIKIYYRAKYSNKQVSDDDVLLMEEAYNEMVSFLRYRRSRTVFNYLRFVRKVGVL